MQHLLRGTVACKTGTCASTTWEDFCSQTYFDLPCSLVSGEVNKQQVEEAGAPVLAACMQL
eukprot:337562-Pelagomonas_calceolata.AAC.1